MKQTLYYVVYAYVDDIKDIIEARLPYFKYFVLAHFKDNPDILYFAAQTSVDAEAFYNEVEDIADDIQPVSEDEFLYIFQLDKEQTVITYGDLRLLKAFRA